MQIFRNNNTAYEFIKVINRYPIFSKVILDEMDKQLLELSKNPNIIIFNDGIKYFICRELSEATILSDGNNLLNDDDYLELNNLLK